MIHLCDATRGDCVCEPCEDCDEGGCCNNCICCDVNRGDVSVTSFELKAFFVSPGMDLSTNFLETYVQLCHFLPFLLVRS